MARRTPRQKWGAGFGMVPGWLVLLMPTANEVLVYVHLAMFGTFIPGEGVYEECRPSVKTLAHGDPERGYPGTGLSESTVRRALKGLVAKRAIIGERRFDEKGGEIPSVYRVHFGAIVPEQEADDEGVDADGEAAA